MISSGTLRTYLYRLLVLNVCLISVSIAASSILLAGTVLLVVVLFIKEKRWLLNRTPVDYALMAYVAVEFISAALSDYPSEAFMNSKRLLLIAIAYGVILSFDSKEKVRTAIVLLSGTVALLSVAEIVLYYSKGTERLYVFQHYMTTGGLKMIVALMVIPFLLSSETAKKERIFFSVSFIPIMVALILTNTRSAWLGLVFGIVVMSLLYYRKLFLFLIAAIVLFFVFAPEQQVDRAKSIFDFSNSTNVGRFNMWSTGIRMWQDKPIFGFGDIDLYNVYVTYRVPTGDEPAGHLHNNYVHLLVTLGAVGLGVVLMLFGTILKSEYSIFRKNFREPFIRNIVLGCMAVFCGFLVNGIFEWNFGDHEIMVFVWFTVGLATAYGHIAERTADV